LTLVRRKWSGQDVPRAASRGCSADTRKSRTAASSVKWPTIGRSADAMPRMVGASAAALARRSASGRAPYPSSAGPNGSGFAFASMYAAAVSMIHNDACSASSEVSPQAVIP
jgi:hypothetical protein